METKGGTASMTTAIRNVNKTFGSFQALHDINLDIGEKEFVAILGPSGCGKTTLLRILAGFEKPTSGLIQMDGTEVANAKKTLPPEKRNLGMVFQSFALWPHLNVRQHIEFPLKHHPAVSEMLRQNIGKRTDDVLRIVNLEPFAGRLPGELSGGQKQRVALARAIASESSLLLMDEPLSSLDAELRMGMRQEIERLHMLTNASIVYVTHDQNEALAMADRIVVMNRGRIEQVGPPEEIYAKPRTPFVAAFVGKANLIKGRWQNGLFRPNLAPYLQWPDHGIADELKGEGLYTLRPEQISMTNELDQGLKGTVQSVQFQGKEMHYAVDCEGESFVIHTPLSSRFAIGAEVALRPDLPGLSAKQSESMEPGVQHMVYL